jgi:hypothetical protein
MFFVWKFSDLMNENLDLHKQIVTRQRETKLDMLD